MGDSIAGDTYKCIPSELKDDPEQADAGLDPSDESFLVPLMRELERVYIPNSHINVILSSS